MGAFFVSACLSFSAQAFCPVETHWPSQRVSQVIDGDTVQLADGRRVRLIGLNTPERARAGTSSQPYAEAATRRLQRLIHDSGNRVGLRIGVRERDHYGRTLAHLYDQHGRNLESQLLAEGLAHMVAFLPASGLESCLAHAEHSARSQRLGLWSHPLIHSPFDLREAGFVIVRARLTHVERNRGGVWLEFDGPLVGRISIQQRQAFDFAQIDNWLGREVEIRGWVTDRAKGRTLRPEQARWMINLSHPLMLRSAQ